MSSRLSNSDRQLLSNSIKAEALRLGFSACGIAKAEPVNRDAAEHLHHWLRNGNHADMHYMANYTDKRLNPQLLMDGLKSIVCVALNYAPQRTIDKGQYQFAAYAYGQDYHDIMKTKLTALSQYVMQLLSTSTPYGDTPPNIRTFCDTAPVLERYWAMQAGLGWTGRNHQLIIPHAGSMFFLGELFLDAELIYDHPIPNRCGNCHACIDACPTKALSLDKEIDCHRCISYQTIENRGAILQQISAAMGNTIYGCDRCQQSCPYNRFAQPTTEPQLQPKEELLQMQKQDWQNLSIDDYRRIFKGSAVKRAKYEGLMRNIKAAADNTLTET